MTRMIAFIFSMCCRPPHDGDLYDDPKNWGV